MPQIRELMAKLLADGKIDSREIESLGELLYADRRIDRAEADFLVELHKRAERSTPGFEKFYYQAIKQHVLIDGGINRETTAWLRRAIFADSKISGREKKLLRELRGEASFACVEFEQLCKDYLDGFTR